MNNSERLEILACTLLSKEDNKDGVSMMNRHSTISSTNTPGEVYEQTLAPAPSSPANHQDISVNPHLGLCFMLQEKAGTMRLCIKGSSQVDKAWCTS